MLESMAGNMPPKHLSASYNSWAAKSGYPNRSYRAITSLMSRRKISRRAEGEWITSGCIAELLGVHIDTPQRWAEKGLIESCYSQVRRGHRYFRRSNIVDLARRRPDLFGGIDRDRLYALLEDSELADAIVSSFPSRTSSGRPVQVVETGATFPSATAAAKAFYVRSQSISFAIKRNGTCAGYHWRHVKYPEFTQECTTQELPSLTPQEG